MHAAVNFYGSEEQASAARFQAYEAQKGACGALQSRLYPRSQTRYARQGERGTLLGSAQQRIQMQASRPDRVFFPDDICCVPIPDEFDKDVQTHNSTPPFSRDIATFATKFSLLKGIPNRHVCPPTLKMGNSLRVGGILIWKMQIWEQALATKPRHPPVSQSMHI